MIPEGMSSKSLNPSFSGRHYLSYFGLSLIGYVRFCLNPSFSGRHYLRVLDEADADVEAVS